MGSIWSLGSLIIGAVFVIETHRGILAGVINASALQLLDHDAPKYMTLDNPSFWTAAGFSYAFGLLLFLPGAIYFTTGDRYLPDIKSNPWFSYLLVFLALIAGYVLTQILPMLYS
ncbi:MAG: hypothetical protein KJO09_10600 [Gammaproteobacteria bacterium]|nr:hypothetical protein [Gammaproteobacteria bacterium]